VLLSWAKVHAVEFIHAAHCHCLFSEWETCSDIDLIAPEIVARPRSYNIPTAANYCNSVPDVVRRNIKNCRFHVVW
jgi:hypothetical protein